MSVTPVLQQTTFVFNKNLENAKICMNINDKINCVLENQNGVSLAILYFINENAEKIDIPEGICVYEYDKETVGKRVILKKVSNSQMFVLCYTDDYDITYNGKVIHKIESQRSWKITHNIINFRF